MEAWPAGGDPGNGGPSRGVDLARLQPMTASDVLDGMIDMLRTGWRAYLVTLAAVLLPLNLVSAVLARDVVGAQGLFRDAAAGVPAGLAGALVPVLAFSLAVAVLVTPLLTGLTCRIAADTYEGGTPTAGAALRRTLRDYPRLVGVTLLLFGAVAMVLALPVGVIVVAVTNSSPGLGVLGGFLALLALPVAIAAAIAFSLSYAVATVEHVGPVTALRRSRELLRGRIWAALGTLILVALLTGFITLLIALLFSVGSAFGERVGIVSDAVGATIASLVSIPLTGNALTLLYFDGRIRREGYDLELLIDEVLGHTSAEVAGG